jgi:DNA-directed RNA polymerase specialized sigma24 family protein
MAFTTRQSVIQKVKNGDDVGWEEFDQCYRKLIFLRAADRGIKEAEREDLLQNVMVSLFKYNSVLHYDIEKGRFRDYLKAIIDRQAFTLIKNVKVPYPLTH